MHPRHAPDCSTGAGLPDCDCGALPMFRVLKPIYERTGDVSHTPEGEVKWWRVKQWHEVGLAASMAEAVARYGWTEKTGFAPVLEPLR